MSAVFLFVDRVISKLISFRTKQNTVRCAHLAAQSCTAYVVWCGVVCGVAW